MSLETRPVPDYTRIFGAPPVTLLARADEVLLGDVIDSTDGPVHVREIVQRRRLWDLAGDPPGHIICRPPGRRRGELDEPPLHTRRLAASTQIRIRRTVRSFGRLTGHTQQVASHNPVKRGCYTHVDGYTAACSCGWKATDVYASKHRAGESWVAHKADRLSDAAYADNSALLWLSSLEVVHPHLPPLPWEFKKIVSGKRDGDGIALADLDMLTVARARQVLGAWQTVLDTDAEDTGEDYRPGPIRDPWGNVRPGHTYLRLSGNGASNGSARVILTAHIDDPDDAPDLQDTEDDGPADEVPAEAVAGVEERRGSPEPRPAVKAGSARYAAELRRTPGKASADGHTGWECGAGASLLVRAETPGPGELGTHHGVIYACTEHQAAAEERIEGGGYEPQADPAPAGHRSDPWPCGHVTAYKQAALAALTESDAADDGRDPASLHPEPDEPDWDSPHFDGGDEDGSGDGEG
ncbi:hypothetical protein [Streptomyces sp. NPDC002845]